MEDEVIAYRENVTKERRPTTAAFSEDNSISDVIDEVLVTAKRPIKSEREEAGLPKPTPPSFSIKRMILGYFAGWSIYKQDALKLEEIDAKKLTHLTYAFAGIDPATHKLQLTDPNADLGASSEKLLEGNFGKFWKLKNEHRHLKTGLAVGGWTGSAEFSRMCASEKGRKAFLGSLMRAVIDFGLDYVDLDWEYPVEGGLAENSVSFNDPDNLLLLVKEWHELGNKVVKNGLLDFAPPLTMAVPTGSSLLRNFPLEDMLPYVSHFLLMTYDFGTYDKSGNKIVDHHANFRQRPAGDTITVQDEQDEWEAEISGDWRGQNSLEGAVKYLTEEREIPKERLVAGVPFYGRQFNGVRGLGLPVPLLKYLKGDFFAPSKSTECQLEISAFSLLGYDACVAVPSGALEKDALSSGATETVSYREVLRRVNTPEMNAFWEPACQSEFAVSNSEPWSTSLSFISYESPRSLYKKSKWIRESGLGGAMIWELSLDLEPLHKHALLPILHEGLAEHIDATENHLNYISSRFENVNGGNTRENKGLIDLTEDYVVGQASVAKGGFEGIKSANFVKRLLNKLKKHHQ